MTNELEALCNFEDLGFLNGDTKSSLIHLETRKRKVLEDNEATWRQKIGDIWMEVGDKNTKFFQKFSKGYNIPTQFGILKPWKGTMPLLLRI